MLKLSKSEVLGTCKSILNHKITEVQTEIEKVKSAAQEETKSSMGDKYETGREMMMQERSKLSDQLALLLDQAKALEAIKDEKHAEVKLGSLVKTDLAIYYVSIALGVIEVNKKKIFVVSSAAPLVREMLTKKEGEEFSFNGKGQIITAIE